MNEKPFCEDESLRSAGGHIHIGFANIVVPFDGDIYGYTPDEQRAGLVRMLDKYLGIPSVLLEPDNKRKELYGKAGAYRPKEYGVEYRTISNFYLSSPEAMQWAFESSKAAVMEINNVGFLSMDLANQIREVIDTNNKPEAERMIREFGLKLI